MAFNEYDSWLSLELDGQAKEIDELNYKIFIIKRRIIFLKSLQRQVLEHNLHDEKLMDLTYANLMKEEIKELEKRR